MDKYVVYCGTRNVYDTMVVAAKSLLCHNIVDKIFFFIEDDNFPNPLPSVIECINVSNQTWFPASHSMWTYMANMRFVVGKILNHIDSILYLDTDTLVLGDISEVFNTNLTGKLFAMVQEDLNDITIEFLNCFGVYNNTLYRVLSDAARPEYPIHPYFNSGVMFINVSEMKNTGMDDILVHEVNNSNHPYPDQDAINLTCHDKIVPLPTNYNVIPALLPDFPHEQIRIKHYASDKPLWKSSLWQSYKRMSWESIMERQAKLIG